MNKLWVVFAVLVAVVSLRLWAFKLVGNHVPEPYLDEVFHIPQTYQYCQRNFEQWDPKITTPPGLYVLGFAYAKVIGKPCSVQVLRSLNVVGDQIVLPLILGIVSGSPLYGLILANVPIVWFFGNLYYTDVWSTVLIFGSLAANEASPFLGALLATLSITFRQTNVIWAAFNAGHLVIHRLGQRNLGLYSETVQCIHSVFQNLDVVVSYGFVGSLFAAFVYANQGITMGDKENHTVGLHGAQILYFSLFALFLSWPAWLSPHTVKKYLARMARQWYFVTLELLAIVVIIGNFTVVHPFILADNRHYTFYLWRRLIQPSWHPYAKYLLVPIYHFGLWQIVSSVTASVSNLTTMLYIGGVVSTLVPSPLFEPRYYIVPFVLWRVLVVKSSRKSLYRFVGELAWYLAINVMTVYIFVYKPFEWSHEHGVLQRFMW